MADDDMAGEVPPGTEISTDLWPDDERGPWRLRTLYFPVGGRLELGELHLVPLDRQAAVPLTSTVLRQLVPSRMAAKHRPASVALKRLLVEHSNLDPNDPATQRFIDPWKERDPAARWSDQLPNIARVYADAWRRGEPPAKAVAERFHVSRSLAGKLVHQCRRRGLLPATTRGKAQGGSQ